MEQVKEYNCLWITFIDYEMTFSSIDINAVLKSLEMQGVKAQYIKQLEMVLKLYH